MIGYLDWVQTVARAVLADRSPRHPLTMWKLAEEVGLPLEPRSEDERRAILTSLDHVLRDLAPHGIVRFDGGHFVEYPPDARRFRVEPLTAVWWELRSGFLAPDEDEFLAALARLSEQPGEAMADTTDLSPRDVFANLGWEWDEDRALTIYRHLKERFALVGQMYGSADTIRARITYSGLVRALDDTGAILREAEEHLQARRLRAAGCIASVELERRWKTIAPYPAHVKRRDPTLEDYNKSAFDNRVIDQAAWTLVSNLLVTRKLCAHVLDREPDADEVRELLAGVESLLRRYPAPK